MSTLHLYEIAAQYRQLAEMDDVPAEVLRDTLEAVEGDLSEKVKAVSELIRTLDASAEAIAAEAKRIAERAARIKRRSENLRGYLMFHMLAVEKQAFEFEAFSVKVRDNPASVIVNDGAVIPAQYLTEIPAENVPDKKALKAALESGEEISGVWLQRSQRLEIKP